jgi:hypothetical protein
VIVPYYYLSTLKGFLIMMFHPMTRKVADLIYFCGFNSIINGHIHVVEMPYMLSGIEVTGNILMNGNLVDMLPNGLKVHGNLTLRRTKVQELPHDLVVHGDVVLYGGNFIHPYAPKPTGVSRIRTVTQ